MMHGRTRSSSVHSDVSSGRGMSVQRRSTGGSSSNEAALSRLPPRSQSMQEARLQKHQSLPGASSVASVMFRTLSDPADLRPRQNRQRHEEKFALSGISTEAIAVSHAAGERLQTSSLQQSRNRQRRQERVDKWVSEHAGMPRRGQQRSFSDLGMPTLTSTPPELCRKPVPLMPSAKSGLTATSQMLCLLHGPLA